MLAVPRVWQSFHDRVHAAMCSSALKRWLWADATKQAARRLREAGYDGEAVPPITAHDQVSALGARSHPAPAPPLVAFESPRSRARLGSQQSLECSSACLRACSSAR
jgi:hypothetical protein